MKKKYIIVIILVVVVIFVVLVGVLGFGPKIAKMPTTPGEEIPTSTITALSSSTVGSSTVSVTISTSTVTVKSYSGRSFSFVYPDSWSILSMLPFSMTNFGGQYKSGGVIPVGGAQITLVTTTIGGPVADIMATELMNATGLTTSTVAVSGTACTKASYRANYAPGSTSQNISIYCSRGSELWKLYLSYPANDAAEKAHLSDFNEVLGSMKFL